MSVSTTTNYGLKKPSDDEFYDVSRYRDNMDAVDTQMHDNEELANTAIANAKTAQTTADSKADASNVYTKSEVDAAISKNVARWG